MHTNHFTRFQHRFLRLHGARLLKFILKWIKTEPFHCAVLKLKTLLQQT